ncbi:pre-rRNA-processing protein TSR1-like protein, partial [Thalictrum thalictroides]
FMFLFKEQRITAPHWRSQRPYLMAQEVDLVADGGNPGTCTLLLSGYLRARSLSVNQLVHVSGAGDFQLCKIDILKDPCPLNVKKGKDLMDTDNLHDQVIHSLVPDPLKQEPLLFENVPDPLAGEQTWPTEAEMADAYELQKQKKKKRILPRGTSDYQAAWIVDDSGDEDSDSDDDRDDGMVLDGENGFSGHNVGNHSDFDDDEVSLDLRDSDEETEAGTAMVSFICIYE